MIHNLTIRDLNMMDLSEHILMMEEWNEDAGFEWGPASIVQHGHHTTVIQEDGKGGLHVATYGMSRLKSLRCYTDKDPQGVEYWSLKQTIDDISRALLHMKHQHHDEG